MSGDTKYCARDKSGNQYLLRMADADVYKIKKHEYDLILQWNDCGIPMSKAVDFGMCDNGEKVYTILEWMEGVEVQKKLSALGKKDQHRLGEKAGVVLKKIHSIAALNNMAEWTERYFSVTNDRIEALKRENLHFDGDDIILDFIEQKQGPVKRAPTMLSSRRLSHRKYDLYSRRRFTYY